MPWRLIPTALLILAFCPALPARAAGQPSVGPDRAYLRGYLDDGLYLAASPARWRLKQWAVAVSAAGLAAGLYRADEEIRSWVQDRRTDATDRAAAVVKPVGDGLVTIPALAVFGLASHFLDHPKGVTVALLSLESFLYTGLAVQTLKHLCHRHRPSADDGPAVWDGPAFRSDDLSFPSGHSSSAFAVASVVAIMYREQAVVPAAAYTIAGLVALSRVHDDRHWSSDVFMGSCLGYALARGVINSRLRTEANKVNVRPVFNGSHYGFALEIKFLPCI